MKIDLFSLLVLLGALQALFFGVFLLVTRTENRFQNRMLAGFMMVFAYNGFETLNWSSGLYPNLILFECFSFVLIFAAGPFLYLYIRSFGQEGRPPGPWRHFIIVYAALTIRLGFLVCWWLHAAGKPFPEWWVWLSRAFDRIAEPMSVLWFTAYWGGSFYAFQKMKNGMMEVSARWLQRLLGVTGVIGAMWIVTVALPYFGEVTGAQQYTVIEVCLVVFVYWMGFSAYHRTRVIYAAQQQQARSHFDQLTEDEILRCARALHQAMETGRLYLDPTISAATVAEKIGVPVKTLSAVLNRQVGKGFNEYINGWRVEAVKGRMLDPDSRHLTLSGIAYECGFNSQPTFQRAFRAVTGFSPGEFLRRQQAS